MKIEGAEVQATTEWITATFIGDEGSVYDIVVTKLDVGIADCWEWELVYVEYEDKPVPQTEPIWSKIEAFVKNHSWEELLNQRKEGQTSIG